MRGAILDLLQLSANRLFEELSEGIRHIVEHGEHLESMAVRLIKLGEHRGAGIVRALAEEESAKVLILIDLVRCPRTESDSRSRTLSWFYNHLAKHIYAKACRWRPVDFAEVKRNVDQERSNFYLDGPNDVDWILSNAAKMEREHRMYVDYVQDITEEGGEHIWVSPLGSPVLTEYERGTPQSLVVASALHRLGLTTPKGLAIVADVWRDFGREPRTRCQELFGRMHETLVRVLETGQDLEVNPDDRIAVQSWQFPLWSLELKPLEAPTIEELRKQRDEHIKWRMRVEAQRDPPPTMRRSKVEALSRASASFETEWDQRTESHSEREHGLRIVRSPGVAVDELESYQRLRRLVRELTLDERMDLVALGWFGKHPESGWANHHRRSRTYPSETSIDYECGLGPHWLTGLERWEGAPELPASLKHRGGKR